MFCKPYSSALLWIVHLETPNISPILIQLNANSHNSSNISPGISKRGLPGVSVSSFPEAKQLSATISGVTGLIAMWCNPASESSSSLWPVHAISRQSFIDLLSLISIYYALVYPYLNYRYILWVNNYKASVSQLVKLQNQVVTVIKNINIIWRIYTD